MSTLVVHAHPLEDSYSAALRDTVTEALTRSGVDFTVARLAQGEQPDLAGVDHLVAVYPTWWGGIPAVLLDWLQTLLCPIVDGGSTTASPLRTIETVSVVTTHGSSRLMNNLQGQPGKQTWSNVVAPFCAPGATFEWVALYKIDRSTEAERSAFLARVAEHFTSVRASA